MNQWKEWATLSLLFAILTVVSVSFLRQEVRAVNERTEQHGQPEATLEFKDSEGKSGIYYGYLKMNPKTGVRETYEEAAPRWCHEADVLEEQRNASIIERRRKEGR